MDFNQRVVINTAQRDWVASPMPGVMRKPLAREDAERGHATSIVRYEPGARFSAHDHPLGEEILVLEGVFSDETGDYPAGTYFRNPQGFRHAPFSTEGCVLLVKLHQFQADDMQHTLPDFADANIKANIEARYHLDWPLWKQFPQYVGPSGWVGIRVDRETDWKTIEDILEQGYRSVAPKRAIAKLDT